MRLSHRDFDALQTAILALYDYRDLHGFKQAVPYVFLRIIPADYFLWNQHAFDPKTRAVRLVGSVESSPGLYEAFLPRMVPFIADHPFAKYYIEHRDPTVLKLSDFFTLSQLVRTPLYQEAYATVEVRRMLTAPVFEHPGLAEALNYTRRGKDFTERDRLVLNLMRPHFEQACRNAEMATARMTAQAKPLAAYELSPREAEIAHWLANGKANSEIAIILNVSPRTVEKHMERILQKLGVENRTTAAVLIASANGG